MRKTRKKIWGIVFLIPILIGFVYFFLVPVILMCSYSFSFVEDSGSNSWVNFDNYKYIFKYASVNVYGVATSFGQFLTDSVISIITDIPIILIFSMIMAVVLNSKFKGRAVARAIFFVPVIFNSRAIDIAVASYNTLANMTANSTSDLLSQMFSFEQFMLNAQIPKWLVTFLGSASTRIYEIVSYSGVQILIFLSAIQSVPKHLYEAAKMEGCSQYEMFWKITFPMVSPMLLASAVYTVVDSFLRSPMLRILGVYSNSKKTTFDSGIILGILSENGKYQLSNYGISAAMAVIFTLVVIALMGLILAILRGVVFYYDE